ncbi:phage tail sheath subtilisin-like domain-containing protein [Roseomonas xinghualingensis]|uniref:phage tail sheath subtilisin-like domain-containing protein n=1 Tax=Roseomonas xinghualingensis TaxID=2986475 RepID=UPI0021F1A09C|nr:phage tail sheath subtilisin-like domain-containing protein [Roseomonas sp. SXEYE001]MCV4206919.1 phage tail protein [Roseomonas sp. SXEYE001]
MVGFTQIPQNLKTTLFYAEVDNSRANSGTAGDLRTLIIGQKNAGGDLPENIPAILESLPWLQARAGRGSMLALQAEAYRKRDRTGTAFVLPLADNTAGGAASAQLTVTAVPTAVGTDSLYVAGRRVQVAVSPTQTPTQIAAAYAAAINAAGDLPVTASAAAAVVTVTARAKGEIGNGISLVRNYLGTLGGEVAPNGLAVTLGTMSGGTANPDLAAALANLNDEAFEFYVLPYTDTTSLNTLRDHLAARWSWDKMLYGGAFSALASTLAGATTFSEARNDQHMVCLPVNGSPTPAWLIGASLAGSCAASVRVDPGLPLHGLPVDMLAPPREKRFGVGDRNTLLNNGLSGYVVQADGTVLTDTLVTTYRLNGQGAPDDSYLYPETLYLLAAAIRRLKNGLTSRFGRFKLASAGTRFRPGSNIVTTAVLRDWILGEYRRMESEGLVQEYDRFAEALVVERNSANRCRVDGLLPIIPIDQFRQFAANIQFRKSAEVL